MDCACFNGYGKCLLLVPFGYGKCLLVMESAGEVRWNKTLKTTRLPEVGRGVLTTAATAAPSVAGLVALP